MRNLRTARENWAKNHRHHGGLQALLRCWRGQRALETEPASPPMEPSPGVEMLTFSVVPWLTALWSRCLHRALSDLRPRLVVGDCSGGLGPSGSDPAGRGATAVYPCLNHHHGEKLDLFFSKVCSSELVLVCDDDIFWLRGEPMEWALDRFAEDPNLAVVSLAPRTLVSSVLEGQVEEPMGSSCLLVRRSLWLREELSFRMAPGPRGKDWFYDTCDLANVELLRRGYGVRTAPAEIRDGLVPLEAISAWILKAQKHSPERLARIADLPVRRTKALRALTTAHRLARFATDSSETLDRRLPRISRRLEGALDAMIRRVERSVGDRIQEEVEQALAKIEGALKGPDSRTWTADPPLASAG